MDRPVPPASVPPTSAAGPSVSGRREAAQSLSLAGLTPPGSDTSSLKKRMVEIRVAHENTLVYVVIPVRLYAVRNTGTTAHCLSAKARSVTIPRSRKTAKAASRLATTSAKARADPDGH